MGMGFADCDPDSGSSTMEDAPGPHREPIMAHPANPVDFSPPATEPEVRDWVAEDVADWDAYVRGHPRATFLIGR